MVSGVQNLFYGRCTYKTCDSLKICVKRDDCETNEVTALLNKYIPGLKPECDIGAELSYQLPDSASAKFEEMFGQLEEQSDELHLNGYGVGITSMEEVFMKVGAEKDNTGNIKDQHEIMNGGSGFRGEDDNESVQCKQCLNSILVLGLLISSINCLQRTGSSRRIDDCFRDCSCCRTNGRPCFSKSFSTRGATSSFCLSKTLCPSFSWLSPF